MQNMVQMIDFARQMMYNYFIESELFYMLLSKEEGYGNIILYTSD